MKKATELKNWLTSYWEKITQKDTINLKENEQSIMTLLTWCNGSRLTTEESLVLFSTIESKFKHRISRDKVQMTRTLIAINEFEGKEKPKTVVNDAIFERPLSEINVDYEIVKGN